MIAGPVIYEWAVLGMFLGSVLHLLILLAFKRRVAPWQAKVVYAIGSVAFFGWLYFRVWDNRPRDWVGAMCAVTYLIGLYYLILSYRRAPYQGEKDSA